MGLLKGSSRTLVPVTGGVDESSPVNTIAPEDCLVMTNFRLSKDGKRIEKRLGMTEEVTNFAEDIYAYSTYYNNANTYCQLAVLESGISRKVGSAAWGSIHTWSPVTLTGTIDPAASTAVVGVGTKFLSELRTGNNLIVSGETKVVSTITDDNNCTVTSAFANNSNDTSPDKSFTLAHPINILEIQGKQLIIHEDASRMLHWDGNDYQIGITEPTTLPTVSTTYPTAEDTLPLNDTFAYANTTALDAVWTDGDAGNGTSTIATSGPSVQGPDAHNFYLKLTSSASSSTSVAKRSFTMTTSIGSKFTIELNSYFDLIGGAKNGRDFHLILYTGSFRLPLYFLKANLCIFDDKGKQYSFTSSVDQDKWSAWKFVVDGTDSTAVKVSAYKDGLFLKEVTYGYADDTNADVVEVIGNSRVSAGFAPSVIYIDNLKITTESTTSAVKTGAYRYAVSFFRGGNYGCESNPIKSKVGTASYVGTTGLNDMVTGGVYTGGASSLTDPQLQNDPNPHLLDQGGVASEGTVLGSRVFRVQIEANGTPDTFKWSEDGGTTWASTGLNITTKNYLSYGVEIKFAATVGHTVGDYWSFTCSACIAAAAAEVINLAAIPTSLDPQVTGRHIYRTTADGVKFYWLATINDNVQATFKDNIDDLALGYEMREDRDIAPNGKFSAWWDNRLWISGDDIVYYSNVAVPEEFDLSARYITVQRGDPGDEITGLVPFKDALYVFRKKSIYSIQANPYGYGIYLVENHTGCRAPWSMVEVNNSLMFISDRGIEVFNGTDAYPMALSDKIERTIKTIDTTKYDYITAALVRDKYEVWFNIPDRTTGSAITIVYNYIYGKFYYFSFYKTPSCMAACENSSYALVTKMGTRDGYLNLCETTYRDNTTAITATYRKGWMGGEKYENVRRIDVEYELPTSMALTCNVYVNFQKTAVRTISLAGSTPNATDIELRRPIKGFGELGQRAEWWAVEFTNAENVGGDLKLNGLSLYHYTTDTKGVIKGD
jgi:hypothetical protein